MYFVAACETHAHVRTYLDMLFVRCTCVVTVVNSPLSVASLGVHMQMLQRMEDYLTYYNIMHMRMLMYMYLCMSPLSRPQKLRETGVIPGADMTTEAALTKLSYLLGQGLDDATIKEVHRILPTVCI